MSINTKGKGVLAFIRRINVGICCQPLKKKANKNNGRSINSRRTVLKQSKTDTLLAKKIQTFFFFGR